MRVYVDQIVRAEVATAQVAGALRSAPVAALTAGGGAGGSAAAAGSPYAGLMAEMSEFDSAFGGRVILSFQFNYVFFLFSTSFLTAV